MYRYSPTPCRRNTETTYNSPYQHIDELVYEWRKTLREDPLLFADREAYYVAVARRIWRQFADAHDMTDAEFEALL